MRCNDEIDERELGVGCKPRNAHFLGYFRAFTLLIILCIDGLLLLLNESRLRGTGQWMNFVESDRAEQAFSIVNSSSALTFISRAFSCASCLMKAT